MTGKIHLRKPATRRSLRPLGMTLAVFTAMALPRFAFSQGCALCVTQAASSGARMIQALRSGIVILIIPPVSICLGAIVLAYRRRNVFAQTEAALEATPEEL